MLPPEPCPPKILTLIDKAACLHNDGQYDQALKAYQSAEWDWEDDYDKHHPMDPNQRLYFKLAAGSVMLSAGRYEDALERFGIAELEAGNVVVHGHPNRAVVHSCNAFALNALGRLDLAFEQLVKASALYSSVSSIQFGLPTR
jgi:tetratricopeptide (TPR) repeat protein